jgi:3-oxoacid CoA-transferase B subunit
MDLLNGIDLVIVAMEHTAKGEPKILHRCTYPLTASRVVKKIVTELCVLDVKPQGLVLSELYEGVTVDEVKSKTQADLIIPDEIGKY